jgi:hypothetical protein
VDATLCETNQMFDKTVARGSSQLDFCDQRFVGDDVHLSFLLVKREMLSKIRGKKSCDRSIQESGV